MSRLLTLLILLSLIGCNREMEISELPGNYQFDLNQFRQTVTITSDGYYRNDFFENNVHIWSDQGKWIYAQSSKTNGIELFKFRFGIKEYSSNKGIWFVIPEKTITGIRKLCFDNDLGRCFEASKN